MTTCLFCQKKLFHMNEFWIFFFATCYTYSCPSIWHAFFFIIFEGIWIFESVPILCKFNVLSLKMIIISNHNLFLFFFFPFFKNVFLYDKLQLFLTHHVHFTPFMGGKGLLKFVDPFWKVLWIPHILGYECF